MVTSTTSLIVSLVGSALLLSANADRDNSYYKPGRSNPNTWAEKMYWADASNVLEDLDQFSGLYVSFHHCAWTEMKSKSGDDESVDESDYWYMGAAPPFGANVAFSLYGSLKGESFDGCGEDTFINSFYTNYGFESFANAMYYSSQYGFSYYGDDDGNTYSSTCKGGYGVGCDYNNGFAVHKYTTDACDPAYFSSVSNSMSSFNSNLQNAQCVQIYNSNNYGGYTSGTGLELLGYSSACFYQNYWSPDGQCPDPYGKLAEYQTNFNEGVKKSEKKEIYNNYRKVNKKAKAMWHLGWVFFLAAALMVGTKLLLRARGSRGPSLSDSKWMNNAEPPAVSRQSSMVSVRSTAKIPSAPSALEERPPSEERASAVVT